jgi:hypothetical protein
VGAEVGACLQAMSRFPIAGDRLQAGSYIPNKPKQASGYRTHSESKVSDYGSFILSTIPLLHEVFDSVMRVCTDLRLSDRGGSAAAVCSSTTVRPLASGLFGCGCRGWLHPG